MSCGPFKFSAIRTIVLATVFLATSHCHAEVVVDFEAIQLGPEGFFSGPADNAVEVPGRFGPVQVGTIEIDGVGFVNRFNQTFGSWSGFSISNQTDTTTAGFTNQYSAFAGSGFDGSSQYAVASGYDDLEPNQSDVDPFDPTSVEDLMGLPSIYLPGGMFARSVRVTNTTYTALAMRQGDAFTKAFGGTSGDDPDFFTLSVFGIDANGDPLSDSIELDLADYRFADNQQDFILDQWELLDLSSLSSAQSLHFNLASSDRGNFGMNTPAYFAIDNLSITAIPEPSSLALLGSVGVGLTLRRRRRKSQP